MLLPFYSILIRALAPAIRLYLHLRQKRGKEHATRITERYGNPSLPRPDGKLLWINAVSVGEAQAALILAETFKAQNPALSILITTVTTTSAELMAKRTPAFGGIHQFTPVDHPDWVGKFLDHWQPDACLWMESELWPTLLSEIHQRKIPCALMNAHMSPKSFRYWKHFKGTVQKLLRAFQIGFAQTDQARDYYKFLGLENINTISNIKYAAAPLPFDPAALSVLISTLNGRAVWVYASTHAGEETLAAQLHVRLKKEFPNLLTIIVPRHPARRAEIQSALSPFGLNVTLRGAEKNPPRAQDDIYIADTLGELGLFYKLAGVACIGRSFSDDGGGGHNPIEAAQLECAVLYGPNVQNLQAIFDEFRNAGAAHQVSNEDAFYLILKKFLSESDSLNDAKQKACLFTKSKNNVLGDIMAPLNPYFKALQP